MSLYVRGARDGIKRAVHRVAKLHDYECGRDWEPVCLWLNDRWVRQIVASDRIKHRKEGERI